MQMIAYAFRLPQRYFAEIERVACRNFYSSLLQYRRQQSIMKWNLALKNLQNLLIFITWILLGMELKTRRKAKKTSKPLFSASYSGWTTVIARCSHETPHRRYLNALSSCNYYTTVIDQKNSWAISYRNEVNFKVSLKDSPILGYRATPYIAIDF